MKERIFRGFSAGRYGSWIRSRVGSRSRSALGYGVTYRGHNIPQRLPARTVWGAWVCLENSGPKTWQRHHPEGKQVDLIVYCNGQLLATHPMPRPEIAPGDYVTLHFPFQAPARPGGCKIVLDLVAQNEARFSDQGVKPLIIKSRIDPPIGDRSSEIYEQAGRINPWYYQPTRGISRSPDGHTYPLFVSKAKGCYLWDMEGRQYVDYVMGWGCSLLGYADERVQKAISDVLHSAAVVPFPYPLEMEVSRMLTEDIPCAEMVLFGKNGSDVCTAGARMARVFSGRRKILTCGYHGWQDFWVEKEGFARTGVPDRPEVLNHSFRFNDLDDFERLFKEHRDDLAAVMLEPSGPAEGVQGLAQDADREFLTAIAEMTRKAGALLIFDEILTGYRYPSGSVQKATGVIPDLACFGKALASGMPLSALVGRAHIFQRAAERIHYGPTFKGELYSFAAAKVALQIYRDEPVAEHVWDYGTRLKRGVDDLCDEVGIGARCAGPPFRMALSFDEPDPERLNLKRTLYLQELLKSGIVTYNGIMLPSYAHHDKVLDMTLDVVGKALETVATAEKEDDFHRYLEIPLLT
ncbi:MAG: aminotransferase class III-fold pyridoxal phosphate-dependent enzyme [Deltaproteobacteria bacterium]|nr:aminotransferase class III-fold pyridoxal phosphate-dependent enzyme [Deltaproteobacteria bacterium]